MYMDGRVFLLLHPQLWTFHHIYPHFVMCKERKATIPRLLAILPPPLNQATCLRLLPRPRPPPSLRPPPPSAPLQCEEPAHPSCSRCLHYLPPTPAPFASPCSSVLLPSNVAPPCASPARHKPSTMRGQSTGNALLPVLYSVDDAFL